MASMSAPAVVLNLLQALMIPAIALSKAMSVSSVALARVSRASANFAAFVAW